LDAPLGRNTRAARGSGQPRRSVHRVAQAAVGFASRFGGYPPTHPARTTLGLRTGRSDLVTRLQRRLVDSVQFQSADASTAEDGIYEANWA
jgi:hypothetical protein